MWLISFEISYTKGRQWKGHQWDKTYTSIDVMSMPFPGRKYLGYWFHKLMQCHSSTWPTIGLQCCLNQCGQYLCDMRNIFWKENDVHRHSRCNLVTFISIKGSTVHSVPQLCGKNYPSLCPKKNLPLLVEPQATYFIFSPHKTEKQPHTQNKLRPITQALDTLEMLNFSAPVSPKIAWLLFKRFQNGENKLQVVPEQNQFFQLLSRSRRKIYTLR